MAENRVTYNQEQAGMSLEDKMDLLLQQQSEILVILDALQFSIEEIENKLIDLNLQDGRDYDILEP